MSDIYDLKEKAKKAHRNIENILWELKDNQLDNYSESSKQQFVTNTESLIDQAVDVTNQIFLSCLKNLKNTK